MSRQPYSYSYRNQRYVYNMRFSSGGWLASYTNPNDAEDILVGGWGATQTEAKRELQKDIKALGL